MRPALLDFNNSASSGITNEVEKHPVPYDLDYLQKTAQQHLLKGIANTYVLINSAEPHRILGYFTISFH